MPQNFPTPEEQAVASYSFKDIASGEGIVNYYLATEEDSTGTGYFLTSNSAVFSVINEREDNAAGSGVFAEAFDLDFDVEFNTSRHIKGDVITNIAMWGENSIDDQLYYYLIIKLYHVNAAATETQIGSTVQSQTVNPIKVADGKKHQMITMLIPDLDQTFKRGEKFRLSVELQSRKDSGNAETGIGIDPANRTFGDGGDLGSRSTILVPFDLDL